MKQGDDLETWPQKKLPQDRPWMARSPLDVPSKKATSQADFSFLFLDIGKFCLAESSRHS